MKDGKYAHRNEVGGTLNEKFGREKAASTNKRVIPVVRLHMSRVMRKPALCICETKAQISCAADQCLCFRYIHVDGTIPLLPKSEISSL